MAEIPYHLLKDPLVFGKALWPGVDFYDKQVEVIHSVRDNAETFVVAGHQLGKDFVSGFLALWFFLTRHPVRIVTTSVKDDHLRVLWGEIGRFIDTAQVPLDAKRGGPLIIRHRELRKLVGPMGNREVCKISYCVGMVSEKGEGMAGHHATHTLAIIDEGSGAEDTVYERLTTWARRILVIGNSYPSGGNFFEKGIEAGDVVLPDHVVETNGKAT